ncbi:hypothetical protein LTR84_007644 [Exophiala bonariae]|uniref:Uncharacterized protein n=1 Tax=Exophiala bonariae TaxID=1690606 RepID=A0AAV9NL31_9EURO|nr:hypothetical protein LTR84_007644 [Exophiala bonariae]
MLLEHYVKITSHALTGRGHLANPFLSPTLELAISDNLVMHAVLAVSGIHCQHSTKDSEVLLATYKHYGTALKGLKYELTHWVEGSSSEKSLNLLLVAILMCMYEALGGNDNGALLHHVRAAREFCSHLIAKEPVVQSSPLAGMLFEAYAYFAALSHLEQRPILELAPEYDPILSNFDCIKQCETFGSYMGCAYRLYELIPTIARLVLYEKRSISRNHNPKIQALYEDMRRAVTGWSAEEDRVCSCAEKLAGMIVQNVLLMLLHECRIDEGQGPQHVMQDIQPLIEETMSLFETISQSPVSSVLAWPMMITGSMMLESNQRQRLLSLVGTHHTHTALADQIVRLLHWVWEGGDEGTFGITGLGKVARQHKTYLCYA